jgi:uncharacterized protein YcbX
VIEPAMPASSSRRAKDIHASRVDHVAGWQQYNIRSDQQNANSIPSRFFEREVTLAETAPDSPALEEYWPDIDGLAHRETVTEESIALSSPKGSFFDYAVAHVILTNTLNRLRELYPQGRFEARRFRPNMIVAVGKGEPDFVENSWVGLNVEIGETLLLKGALRAYPSVRARSRVAIAMCSKTGSRSQAAGGRQRT